MLDRFELQKLRDLPIEGVAGRLGIEVVKHKALCPFHDDHHASLSFSTRRNTYRCFACGAHGGTIDLVMRLLNIDFLDACRWLADEHNVILTEQKSQEVTTPLLNREGQGVSLFDATRYERFFERPWLNEEARKFLFDERKLDERVVRWCRLTSWKDKQGILWLQIPYFNKDGKLIGVQNRNLIKGAMPRFRFPQGGGCITLYNLPVLNKLRPGDELYITEGCSDCWAMLSAGHKAIAIPSATLLTQKDAELLSTLHAQLSTKFGMYPDRDAPGERLFLQLQRVLPSLVHHQLPPDCKDFSDLYLKLKAPNILPP